MKLFIKNTEDIEIPKKERTVTLFIDAKTLELKGKSDKNELFQFAKEVEVMVHPNYSDITATPEDVTVGKIFIDQNGAFVVGTKEEATSTNGPKLDDNGELPLTLLALQADSSVTLSLSGITSRPGIQYRTTGETEWKTYECGTEITFSTINEYVQFRNTEEVLSTDNNKIVYFTMTGKIAGSGNLQSMLNYSDTVPEWAFYRMFAGCTSLITSPEMPGKYVGALCYPYMFEGCTGMIYGPSILPIETMEHSCCNFMFINCTSLIIPPDLPCKTLANFCYSCMFKGCSSLERTPLKLPATTLANNCYKSMFYGCTSLEEAMEILPAETLTESCYSTMFQNCERLVSAPKLPAKTLKQYSYSNMFSGCKSLRFIAADFTNYSASNAITGWTYEIASKGIMLLNETVSLSTGSNGIPEGWISDVYNFTIEKEPIPTLDQIFNTNVEEALDSFDLISSPRTEGQYFIGTYKIDFNAVSSSQGLNFILEGSNYKIYLKYNSFAAKWEFWHEGYSTSYPYLSTSNENPFATTDWDCNATWDKIILKFGNYVYDIRPTASDGSVV